MRPPNLSHNIPTGSLNNEPVKIGVATNNPNWVSDKSRRSFMGMPIIENITHIAKHDVNANVLAVNTELACAFFVVNMF